MYINGGRIKDPLKQDLALKFCRSKSKNIIILTKSHINDDQIQHIRDNCLGLKGDLCPLRLLPLMTNFSVLMPLQGAGQEKQLTRRSFFKGLQNYIENINKGNENKIILENFNYTMDKLDWDPGRNIRIIYGCCFEDLWRRENPDSSEFTH